MAEDVTIIASGIFEGISEDDEAVRIKGADGWNAIIVGRLSK